MKQILQCIYPEITKVRHQIHANPELAYNDEICDLLILGKRIC